MRYEPSIDRARLVETVCDVYGLPVDRLAFVPVGYAAVCYTLHCAGETEADYILKLWPDTRAGRASAARRDTSLALTRALYDRGLYPRVPYPIPTRDGALWASVAGIPFAVFPFLAGQAPPFDLTEWPLALRDELARSLATIHRATSALADVLPAREDFDIPFEAQLRRGLEVIERIGPRERPGLRALREMALPRQADILAQLARLQSLQATVRPLSGPFVLCHTDIGADNLLVDADGRFGVLDWDDATAAPPEHDLQCAIGADVGRFLAVYAEAGGSHPLRLDHFAFYLLRRYLGDMTARLLRMLEENTTVEQDWDALDGMETWGFAQWAVLDRTLDDIAAALRNHHA